MPELTYDDLDALYAKKGFGGWGFTYIAKQASQDVYLFIHPDSPEDLDIWLADCTARGLVTRQLVAIDP